MDLISSVCSKAGISILIHVDQFKGGDEHTGKGSSDLLSIKVGVSTSILHTI